MKGESNRKSGSNSENDIAKKDQIDLKDREILPDDNDCLTCTG